MKDIYKGFYRLSDEEFVALWQTALFVPDASFLCNLYRLPAASREAMFNALRAVSDRLWVPHHVGLEFFRNRPKIIADQGKKFSAVKNLITELRAKFSSGLANLKLKKRHSLINPDPLEERLKELLTTFDNEISALEEQKITTASDPILDELSDLINDKIGDPPANQDEIEGIYKEGKVRYRKKIPPGYMDAIKAKDKRDDSYGYGGIIYQRQFGDLLIWNQLLSEIKNQNHESVIFLTDDSKEDWFWIIGGQKKGPRPELIEEISRIAGTKYFHIYSSDQFLKYTAQYLKIDISEESIKAAKDIADVALEESDPLWIAENNPESIVEDIVSEHGYDLVNTDDKITGEIAMTNAFGWGMDTYEITDFHYDEKAREITFSAEISLTGDQDDDKPFSGDQIDVGITGTILYTGDSFTLVDYEIGSCESNF